MLYDYRVKGLKHRRAKDEAVAAYFSHIGDLYQVHHLWCEYNNKQLYSRICSFLHCDAVQWLTGRIFVEQCAAEILVVSFLGRLGQHKFIE